MGKKEKMANWEKIESKLQVADIILVRERRLISKVIFKGTDSYWSHSLIVFSVPDKKSSFKSILVVGAEARGIEMHRIQKFSKKLNNSYDMGIKRVPNLSKETREKVLAYMLNNVDIPYDYSRLLAFFINYLKRLFQRKKNKKNHLKRSLVNRGAFICSSFIQKAFFEAMPNNEKDSVLFIENLNARAFLEEVTPADIANSKNCDWIYNEHK